MDQLALLILCLAGINLVTFALFAWDKVSAIKGSRRISEGTLLTLALVGGTPGAFIAQQRLRHKTRKQPFRSYLIMIAVLHAVLLVALAVPLTRHFMLEQLRLLLAQ
ncbi:DUF1294 domain-containing protein [Anderseniella sp. Alg231-50]|uniref:DUF1294 domain-containing protein n=1 Tax=Anderseniella sp. Alg231-50 TaxID=1922226 RepID=UPI000D5554A6